LEAQLGANVADMEELRDGCNLRTHLTVLS